MNDIISTLIATAMTTGAKLTFNIYADHTTVEMHPVKEAPLIPVGDPVEIPEAKKRKTEKKPVDHGRIVALYTANPPRSVAWIADDMGISSTTVVNHLKQEGIYKTKGDRNE